MTREERWQKRYEEVIAFMEKNHRDPSKHYPDEKLKRHWVHHNRKLLNSGQQNEERKELFEKLLALAENASSLINMHS